MDQNDIEVIPTDFGKLTRLETLSLDENNISILPKELCSLPRLQELSLSQNQIPHLCENLASLEKLRILNINSNPILELPESLAKLQKLEYINLWDVPLQSEPKELYELNKLQVLCLNPPDHYPHPRVIRNLKKRLQSRVDILSTDGWIMIFWLACSLSPSMESINDNPIDKGVIIPAGTYEIGAPNDKNVPHK